MCRHRYCLAAVAVLIFSVPAAAQIWNPFASKTSKTAPPAMSGDQKRATPSWSLTPTLPDNPLALDKLLPLPGITQPVNRPVNQPTLTQRIHESAQRFVDDARRVVTPPMLQNRNISDGPSWQLPKTPNLRDLAVVPEFLKPRPPQRPPAPTLSEWIAQERPE